MPPDPQEGHKGFHKAEQVALGGCLHGYLGAGPGGIPFQPLKYLMIVFLQHRLER